MGLVDDTCHPADLRTAAERVLRGGGKKEKAPKKPLASRAGDFLSRTPLGGPMVWEKAKAGVLEKTGGKSGRRQQKADGEYFCEDFVRICVTFFRIWEN